MNDEPYNPYASPLPAQTPPEQAAAKEPQSDVLTSAVTPVVPWPTLPRFASDRGWERGAQIFIALAAALFLYALPRFDLIPDEAYYWDWSRHLALGYYDQGPFIAYLIRLTTFIFSTNEFGVRFGALASACGTLWCVYLLGKRIAAPIVGFFAVVLLGVTPLMAAGSLLATYDSPLVFFWALTLVYLERALFAAPLERQSPYWRSAGLAMGMGFLCKHTMVLIIPCVALFLHLSPTHRFWKRRAEPYLAVCFGLMLYSGVIIWNAQHHWWTFEHLLFLSGKDQGFPLRRLIDFIAVQTLLLGPAIFFGCLAVQRHIRAPQRLFLVCMGTPVFVFFCLLALKTRVQGNWAPFAWLTPTVLLAAWLAESMGARAHEAKRIISMLFVLMAMTTALLTALIASPDLRMRYGIHLPVQADRTNEAVGWEQLASRVNFLRGRMTRSRRRKVFIAGNGYQYCAELAFYLPDHPQTFDLFLHDRLTMYAAYVGDLRQHLGQDAIFVNDSKANDADLRRIFTRVEWEPALLIWRRPLYNQPIRTIYIARCYGYRRYTGLLWANPG